MGINMVPAIAARPCPLLLDVSLGLCMIITNEWGSKRLGSTDMPPAKRLG